MQIRRGDIFYADLSPVVGSEQGGIRPVLIIQNDIGKQRLKDMVCHVDKKLMTKVDEALRISLELHT